MASDPQRFRIRPRLVVDPKRRAGAVTGLHSDRTRGRLLAVHAGGSTRLWDLERGVQAGGALGEDVVAGAVRGFGRDREIVAVHSDGSRSGFGRDGVRRPLGGRIDGFDPGAAPILSGDGSAMAYRTAGTGWNVREESGERFALPDAAREARPMLSRDGSTIVYRAAGGAMVAARLTGRGVRVLGEIDGCKRRRAGDRRRSDRRWPAGASRRRPGLRLRVGPRRQAGSAAALQEARRAPLGRHRRARPERGRAPRRGRRRERRDQRLVDLRKGAAGRVPDPGPRRLPPPESSIRIGGGC